MILVIMNPSSGQGDAEERRQKVEAFLEERGLDYEIRETKGEGDALNWARETTADLVIACGGDGTIMEAMSGLIEGEHDTPLAQVPAGTANLLARSIGIPTEIEDALELAVSGVCVTFDVGHLPEHERYFAIVAGAGWDARMIEDAPREVKDKLGFFAYLLSGIKHLFTLRRSRVTLKVDGKEHRFRAHTVMLVNIGELAGTNLKIGNINPHDGKLDMAVAAPDKFTGILRLIYRLARNDLKSYRDFKLFSAKEISVEAIPPLELQIDGEVIGETPFRARVVPEGAKLIVPPDYAEEKKLTPFEGAQA